VQVMSVWGNPFDDFALILPEREFQDLFHRNVFVCCTLDDFFLAGKNE